MPMQNENNENTISSNDTHNTAINATDTADISKAISTTASNAFSKKIGLTMYTVQIFSSKKAKRVSTTNYCGLLKMI